MAYGTIKVDTITFTDGAGDKSVTISGLVQNPTFTGNVTVTGTVSGTTATFTTGTFTSLTGTTSQGTTATYTSGSFTSLTGVTTSGTTANFVSGVFTTQISGATITGTAGAFATLTGGVATLTSGVFALGTQALPSITFTGDTDTGIYSPGANQVAITTSGTGRLFVDASGNVTVDTNTFYVDATNNRVGIGTASPNQPLHVVGNARFTASLLWAGASTTNSYVDGATAGLIKIGSNDRDRIRINPTEITFNDATSEFARIDSSGRLLVGTSSARLLFTDYTPTIQLEGTTNSTSSASLINNSNGAAGPTLFFAKSRATSNGGVTVVSADDELGVIAFNGADGTDLTTIGATIKANVDGTPGNNDLPTRLVFSTTADGASSPTERMRITSAGLVGVGTSTPFTVFNSYKTITGGNPATSGTTDNNVIARIQGGSVGLDIGGTAAGSQWIQPRDVNNFANNYGLFLCPNGGNVGIGTTSPAYKLHTNASADDNVLLNTAGSGYAAYFVANGGGRSGLTGALTLISFNDASATITNKSNAALTFGTNDTERARIDSSGRLLVGTSSARSSFFNSGLTPQFQLEIVGDAHSSVVRNSNNSGGAILTLAKTRSSSVGGNTIVADGDDLGYISFQGADNTDFAEGASIKAVVDGTPGANDMPGRLVFSTTADGASSPTERMRIGQNANVRITQPNTNADGLTVDSTNGSFTSSVITVTTTRAAGTTALFFYGLANAAQAIIIYNNGNIVNANNSYGAISDIKLKENIVDASSQWDDIKALQVRKYNFKEGQTHTQIGLVAQEVELVSPGLVSESPDRDAEGNDLGTVTKSVNYSVLYMKAVKALQEAMERIEQLEQRLTDAGIA